MQLKEKKSPLVNKQFLKPTELGINSMIPLAYHLWHTTTGKIGFYLHQ